MALKDFVNGEILSSFAKKFKQHILNDLLGGKKLVYLTQEEYNNLTDAQKHDESIIYNIVNPPGAEAKIVMLTQEEYDSLDILDPDTLYIIE